jgi:hypothetical protein
MDELGQAGCARYLSLKSNEKTAFRLSRSLPIGFVGLAIAPSFQTIQIRLRDISLPQHPRGLTGGYLMRWDFTHLIRSVSLHLPGISSAGYDCLQSPFRVYPERPRNTSWPDG